jgi:hypothetical protein
MSAVADARRRRFLGLLWAAAASSLFAGGGLLTLQDKRSGGQDNGKLLFPQLEARKASINSITIASEAIRFSMLRSGSAWVMPHRDNFPVQQGQIDSLLNFLAGVTDSQPRTADPALFDSLSVANPEDFGNGTRISLVDSAGASALEVLVGQRGQTVYLRKAGDNQVYRAVARLGDLLEPAAWLDLEFPDIDPETIISANANGVEIVRRSDGGFTPASGMPNANATATALAVTDFHPVDVRRATSGRAVSSHVWTLENGQSVVIETIGLDRGAGWVRVAANIAPGSSAAASAAVAELNRKADGWEFLLPAPSFGNLTFPPDAILTGPQASPVDPATLQSED